MVLELLLFGLIIIGVLLVSYKGAVHEFQILQKDWAPNIDWSALLTEQLPIVIRNVCPEWKGVWTRKSTERKTWPTLVKSEDGQILRTTWNEWVSSAPGEPLFVNGDEIAEAVKIPIEEWRDGGFRKWSWLPTQDLRVGVLGPSKQSFLPVQKTKAAATVIQSTDGAPLQLWLAHDGAIPASVSEDIVGKDPWSLNSEEVPWIDEVKFIEVKLRPGNAIVIPTHWWWAARTQLPIVSNRPSMGDGAWFWISSFQTVPSLIVSKIAKK